MMKVDVQAMWEMYSSGQSMEAVADQFGIKRQAVSQAFKRHGFKVKGRHIAHTQAHKMKVDTCIKLYHKIVAFIDQFGYAPNYREMCQLAGIKTTSLIPGYLAVLKSWQWIEFDEGKSRSLRIIRPTEIPVSEKIREGAFAKAEALAKANGWDEIEVIAL